MASGLVLTLLAASTAAFAGGQPLAALDKIEKGEWELRERGGEAGDISRLCVADPRRLLQLRHGGTACQRYVIEDSADHVTVSYSCPGAGQGRTTLRVENSRLVQIQSQGIANQAPFSFTIEARRLGRCS